MPTADLTEAFLVGRNSYLIDTLAFQGVLDTTTAQFRLQYAPVGDYTWHDWATVSAAGLVNIPNLTSAGLSVAWTQITGTPTTLAGYGITSPLNVAQGGIGVGTLASNGVLYGNTTSAVQALAVNATATNKFLRQVSSGAPTWAQPAIADLSDGTNVALLNAANAFTGSGTTSFSAATTGNQGISVTNTLAGVANSTFFSAANNLGNSVTVQAFSSTFTPAGDILADGARLIFGGAGGLSISATNAAGVIRFYTNGFTEQARIFSTGGVSIGNTTDPGAGSLSVTGTGLFTVTGKAATALAVRFNAANPLIGFGIANSNGFGYIGYNTKSQVGSDIPTYDITNFAAQIRMDNARFAFSSAASGAAGGAITFTELMRIHASGGVSIGNTTDPGATNLSVTGDISAVNVNATTKVTCSILSATGHIESLGGIFAGASSNLFASFGVPTITAHVGGTGPTISGTDVAFLVTTNGATSVTVTFSTTFAHAPAVAISVNSTGITSNVASTTSTATFVLGGGSANFMAICLGY